MLPLITFNNLKVLSSGTPLVDNYPPAALELPPGESCQPLCSLTYLPGRTSPFPRIANVCAYFLPVPVYEHRQNPSGVHAALTLHPHEPRRITPEPPKNSHRSLLSPLHPHPLPSPTYISSPSPRRPYPSSNRPPLPTPGNPSTPSTHTSIPALRRAYPGVWANRSIVTTEGRPR